jgi:sulfur carrier protein
VSQPALAELSISVNGEHRRIPVGSTVRSLLQQLAISGRVAVAIDREVVPRSQHAQRQLRDGDRVEILEAVGGG